ncbi:hypothetical protein NE237_010961 [Protea cynaroides]|uniref:Uncharacterized protein n=1 Tax=Protea cynaroides TaxID=273540 RepID=A0A9Q0L1L4_9MAGN|nr:hypothetical protein NE237_010961 [Protea cynaroides]
MPKLVPYKDPPYDLSLPKVSESKRSAIVASDMVPKRIARVPPRGIFPLSEDLSHLGIIVPPPPTPASFPFLLDIQNLCHHSAGIVDLCSQAHMTLPLTPSTSSTASSKAVGRQTIQIPQPKAEILHSRETEFAGEACRSIPTIMDIYYLEDVVTKSELRSSVSAEIRKNAHVKDPKVIDMLLFKAAEELGNIVQHAKQRHHIIGQYVVKWDPELEGIESKDYTEYDITVSVALVFSFLVCQVK